MFIPPSRLAPAFAGTEYVIMSSSPLAVTDEMEIQLSRLVTIPGHAGYPLTRTLPLPPPGAKLSTPLLGVDKTMWSASAGCNTVKVWPAMVIVPERPHPEFLATE